MRFLILWLSISTINASDIVKLNNDRLYEERYNQILSDRPDISDLGKYHEWLAKYGSSCIYDRKYVEAEIAFRAMINIIPQYFPNHSNLSVALGKQGKYEEALREAEIAKLLCGGNSVHPDMVACSWLYYLGMKDEAHRRLGSIKIPVDKSELRMYLGNKACFYATVGDIEVLKETMKKVIEMDPEHIDSFKRDIVFDKYRNDPCFIEIIGKTIE